MMGSDVRHGRSRRGEASITAEAFIHKTHHGHFLHKDIQNHITPASFSCSRRAMRTALTDTANCARIRVTTPRSTPGQNPCNHLATSPDRRVDCGGHTDTTHTATSPFTFTYMFTFICPLGLRGLRCTSGRHAKG